MSATNPDWHRALVPVFLVAQILAVHGAAGRERPPLPVFGTFPAAFGQWKLFRQDPIDPAIATELRADHVVSQTYIEPSSGSYASLLVAWFQTQREGARQPHSPKVCLPGAGWTPRIADEVTIDTAQGPITVNRYIVDRFSQRAVILYWYQTPRRVIADEWAAKFWLAADALRDRRSDTALIRVTAWPGTQGNDESATAVATGFALSLYPVLKGHLPQ